MQKLATLIAIFFLPAVVLGAGCEQYPYYDGLNIEDVHGGTKIIATATAVVSFDDYASVLDAKDEATMLAKATISEFLTEGIHSDKRVTRAVQETKSMTGTAKATKRQEVIKRVKKLRNTSRALLRGVIVLGDCYTKGSIVRVSVGIKPKTINDAGNLARGISNSVHSQPSPGFSRIPRSTTPSSTSGHINTGRFKNF